MKIGPFHLQDLDRDYICIIQIKHDPGGALRQATLRLDKVHDGLIRLGETPNDEANGWQYPEHIEVISILGVAVQKDGKWEARPYLEVVSEDEAYAMVT